MDKETIKGILEQAEVIYAGDQNPYDGAGLRITRVVGEYLMDKDMRQTMKIYMFIVAICSILALLIVLFWPAK